MTYQTVNTTNYRHVHEKAGMKMSFSDGEVFRVTMKGCEDIYFIDRLTEAELETLISSARSAVRAMIAWKDSRVDDNE